MLTHMYVYLLGNIACVMNKNIVKSLINDVLNYYLYKNININDVWEKLIVEENHFVQKISSLKKKYNRINKTKSKEDTIKDLKTLHGYDVEIVNLIMQQ